MADRGLSGILLVGGASSRFGSPKAFARFEGETLAERAWRLLGETCDERIAVGQVEGLPFPALADEGTGPVAAIAAGLRHATQAVAVVVPVDMPLLTGEALRLLAGACRDAAIAQAGPLPCAVALRNQPAFETGERRLRTVLAGLDTARVGLDAALLANVNEPTDLRRIAASDEGESMAEIFRSSYTKLPAQDVERARAFYRDVLGFEPVREHQGHLFYECGGSSFLVFPSSGSPSGAHDQLGFAVDDVEATAATLRGRGVELEAYEAPPGCSFNDGIMDYGAVKACWFKDSEGNLISVAQFVGR